MAAPRTAWGIDIGNRALKAIKLTRDAEQIRIDDFEIIEHDQILSQAGDNKETLIQTSLANFAQRHPSKGAAVAIGVSGQASFARFIKLPPVDPSKISEIVRFEAIQQIPFPLEDVEWSYQLFQSPDSPEVEVGIFAMRRELVNASIKYYSDVGLQVNAVQMSPLAVYNGLRYDNRIEGTTMIIDVGAENSDLIIAEGENVWMRSIPIGGNNFTEALVKSFQLKFPKAEELKRNAATSKYGRQILQAMKPVFSDLVGEIQRSIGFYSSTHRESRIVKVLALGGTFRLPGLQKYLQQNLQLEVARIDRLEAPMPTDARFAATFNENILSSIGAYGLALQAMDEGKIKSSLLPEKIRRERMWREKTKWFALAASLFVVGTAIPITKLYADRYAFDGQEATRTSIASTHTQADRLSKQWTSIESSGNEDRTQIGDYQNLLTDRDLNIALCEEIGKSFPKSDPADAAKPRAQRRNVDLVGWSMKYVPDINSLSVMPDDAFNPQAEHVEMAGVGAGAAGSNSSGGYVGGNGMGTSASATASGPPRRGFLLTILCRTPNDDPTPLVSETVVKYLRARSVNSDLRPESFCIDRVTIPSKVKMSVAFPGGTLRPKVTAMTFTPPANGANDQAIQPLPEPPPDANAAPEEKFPDPAHKGESARDDSLVTVLALVWADPPAPQRQPVAGKR